MWAGCESKRGDFLFFFFLVAGVLASRVRPFQEKREKNELCEERKIVDIVCGMRWEEFLWLRA